MRQGIASGLLGRSSFQGGAARWILGLVLHFFIALSMTAYYYYTASRKLPFLKEYPLICGLFYGMALYLVMNLVVVPLSAIHAGGPIGRADLIHGLLRHMFLSACQSPTACALFRSKSPGLPSLKHRTGTGRVVPRRIILHASDMGQPLYCSMGFMADGRIPR